jgi:hypothetical protein
MLIVYQALNRCASVIPHAGTSGTHFMNICAQLARVHCSAATACTTGSSGTCLVVQAAKVVQLVVCNNDSYCVRQGRSHGTPAQTIQVLRGRGQDMQSSYGT